MKDEEKFSTELVRQAGRTVRAALGSWGSTVRLLMIVVVVVALPTGWHLLNTWAGRWGV